MIRLEPIPHERPWGGTRLAELCHAEGRIGEAWIYQGKFLLKWLDAQENLSVQNHPSEPGKSKREAWFFVKAPASGRVITGWRGMLDSPDPLSELEYTDVKEGDLLELPSGCVHALTAGAFVLEIQEPRDVTFRIYDWGRGRELSIDEATRSRTTEKPVLHDGGVIERPEFFVNVVSQAITAPKEGVLSFVSGRRFLESYLLAKGERVTLEPGERAVFASAGEA